MSLVSIYIPTHNRSEMLKRAIDSVLAQSHSNIEIIVVDDGSTDDTPNVIDDYKKKSRIISLRNETPRGACYSRNRAINIAQGEFITGLDDDDEFEVDHIKVLIENYEDRYSFIASSLKENDGKNLFVRKEGAGKINLELLLHTNSVGNQVFTKTEYLKKINGFDEELPALQDYDTWLRLVKEFGEGFKLDSATYIWNTGHEQGRISNSNEKRILALKLLLSKHGSLMSKSHDKSRFIFLKKIENTSLSFFELLNNINRYNYKSAISLYVNLNLAFVGKVWREVKGIIHK